MTSENFLFRLCVPNTLAQAVSSEISDIIIGMIDIQQPRHGVSSNLYTFCSEIVRLCHIIPEFFFIVHMLMLCANFFYAGLHMLVLRSALRKGTWSFEISCHFFQHSITQFWIALLICCLQLNKMSNQNIAVIYIFLSCAKIMQKFIMVQPRWSTKSSGV